MSIAELSSITLGQELKASTVGCKLSVKRWGTTKTLDDGELERVAVTFDAKSDSISASKKLIDTKDPKFKAISSVLSRAKSYWNAVTVPYPDNGIRLLRTDRIEEFENNVDMFRNELLAALVEFDAEFYRLKQAAKDNLRELFDENDYPMSVLDLFSIHHEYHQIDPPKHLMDLHPEIYEREKQRIAAKFDEAIQLAEAAFADELQKMLDHAIERLTDTGDGKKKKFNDSLMENFREFIDRFHKLNVSGNQQLNDLVEQIKQVAGNVDCEMLRANGGLREHIKEQMLEARNHMATLIVDRPHRKFRNN